MIDKRLGLTFVWLFFFFTNVLITLSYAFIKNEEGVVFLSFSTASEALKYIIGIYVLYVADISASWYFKPFRRVKESFLNKIRFQLAVTLTLFFNLIIFSSLLYPYFFGLEIDFLSFVKKLTEISTRLSIIVAPYMFYYFGRKNNTPH